MKAILVKFLIYLAGGLLLLNALFYFQQAAMVFYPLRTLEATPRDWGLAFEEVRFRTEDGETLHGWYLPCARPAPQDCDTLLFLHGNAGNISHRGDSLRIFHRLGLNVFIFDYRGYGQSSGSPSERGLYRDARAAWKYLVEQRGVPARRITVFGRSLGGVVATKLAVEVEPARLILESTFSSARDMARHMMPWLSRVVILRYDFDAEGAIRGLRVPLLMLHSPEDEIIPFELGQRLFAAAPQAKTFVRLRGDHNYGFLLSQPDYQQALARFLAGTPQ